MDWAVHNGYLDKSLDKGLKPTKGADSSREAFSQDQVKALNHQCWDIEIMTFEEVVANGKVRVKLTADVLQSEAVAFPLVPRITLC
jgi:hypothetical protein